MLCFSGAKNIIAACQECKVKRLLYNSSADVVLNSWQDIDGGDESLPYSCKVSLLSGTWLTEFGNLLGFIPVNPLLHFSLGHYFLVFLSVFFSF